MLTITLFFWLKKLGFGVSAAKAWVAVSLFTAAAAGTVTVGAVATVKYVIEHTSKSSSTEKQSETIQEETPVSPQTVTAKETGTKSVTPLPVNIKYKSVLIPFSSGAPVREFGEKLQAEIFQKLRGAKGENTVCMPGTVKENPPYVISGSVQKVGTDLFINIKLINNINSEVLLIISKKAPNEDEALKMSSEIASQISSKL